MRITPLRLDKEQRLALRIIVDCINSVILAAIDNRTGCRCIINISQDFYGRCGHRTRQYMRLSVWASLRRNVGLIDERRDQLKQLTLNLGMLNFGHTLFPSTTPPPKALLSSGLHKFSTWAYTPRRPDCPTSSTSAACRARIIPRTAPDCTPR